MANPSCDWIRGRLPLGVGVGDGLAHPADEAAVELDVEERRSIERHLAGCPACRRHRSELAGALGALAAAAGALPAMPESPSLWPALERRIAGRPAGGEPVTTAALLDDDRPLRSAWVQDTLREVAESAGLGGWAGRSSGGTWRAVGIGLAASILMLVALAPASWLRDDAEAVILADVGPTSAPEPVPVPMASASPDADAAAADPGPDRGLDAREVAQVGPIATPAEPTRAVEPTRVAEPTPTVDGGSVAQARLGFDLDLGVPMPHDGRDARPIY